MRVLHLIDSLTPGGAERMAVNLCNALNEAGIEAWLCPTRREGLLKAQYRNPRHYFYAGKQHFADFRAFFRLLRFIRLQKIEVIHAHSSSVYWATLLHWLTGAGLLWHDHNGSLKRQMRPAPFFLKLCSRSFDAVCSVNEQLAGWAKSRLSCAPAKVFVLPNFAVPGIAGIRKTRRPDQFNILCLANIRPEKDQLTLLEAFALVQKEFPERNLKLQLVGDTVNSDYARAVRERIRRLGLENDVQLPGLQLDVQPWLSAAGMGVLSSASEGMPVAVLEYGMAGLPVVCTSVGACAAILDDGDAGLLCKPGEPEQLALQINKLLKNNTLRISLGQKLSTHIQKNYSEKAVVKQLIGIYLEITGERHPALQSA